MPKLLINENSTLLCIEIKKYQPSNNNREWDWRDICDIHIKIKNNYLDFDATSDFLDNAEIEWVSDWLKKLLKMVMIILK